MSLTMRRLPDPAQNGPDRSKPVEARRLRARLGALDERVARLLTQTGGRVPSAWRYVLAVVFALGATSARWALMPWLGVIAPYALPFLAVVVTTTWLGFRAGLLALVAGVLAVEALIIGPAGIEAEAAAAGRIGVALTAGALFCYLLHALRRAGALHELSAGEALARRELELRALVENVSSGVALVDAGGRFSLYNQRFLSMFGLSPDAGIANVNDTDWSAWQVFAPDGQLLHVDEHPVRKAALTRQPVRNQLVGVQLPSGGSLTWMLISAAPLFAADGSIEQLICTYHDVTVLRHAEEALRKSEEEIRRSEEALRRSEDMLSFALTTAHTGAWDLDLSTHRARRSPQHDRIFGYAELLPEWTYEMFLAHVVDEDREAVNRAFARAVETRGDWSFECRIRRSDGPVRWIWAAGRHREDEHGTSRRMAGIVQDITERKEAEEALRAANLRLAEEDRGKNEFLAVLSHELRNPLLPIRNSLYALERATPGSAQASAALAIITRQADQLSRLVDDLLDVTRISRNKIQLQRGPLDLNDVVRRTVEDHRSLFEAKEIRLDASLAAHPLPIDGDDARLQQAVGNLLHNAAKFTPRGGLVMVRTAAAGTGARLRILDSGAGMDPEVLRRLFQPFVQAEMTLDRSPGGLGLGLALVKGLVEMHGGEVCAHSGGPGKGSEFVLELPLAAAGTRPGAAAPAAAPPARRRRALVVEDNEDAAESLRVVLELQHHTVEVAHDGREALERARAFRPDIVLCDIGLPGMDGYEVAKALRREPALAGVYLVALSGYALPDDLARAANAGFNRHLAKPATPDAIARLLAELPPARGGEAPPDGRA